MISTLHSVSSWKAEFFLILKKITIYYFICFVHHVHSKECL